MVRVLLLAGVAGMLAGCVSTTNSPELADVEGYPSLREVPRSSTANTNQRYWNGVEQDLVAAGQAVKDNPRSQPATEAEDPATFIEEAREDLEETRQSHSPQ